MTYDVRYQGQSEVGNDVGVVFVKTLESGLTSLKALMCVRCRACSTAERTATNIIQAPIACAHHTPRAPRSSHLCSPLLLPLLLLPLLLLPLLLLPAPAPFTPAPHACAPRSSLALPALPAPHLHSLLSPLLTCAPCSPCSSRSCSLCSQLPFRLWHCSQTFLSTTCARYSVFRLCFSALSLAPWTLPLLV